MRQISRLVVNNSIRVRDILAWQLTVLQLCRLKGKTCIISIPVISGFLSHNPRELGVRAGLEFFLIVQTSVRQILHATYLLSLSHSLSFTFFPSFYLACSTVLSRFSRGLLLFARYYGPRANFDFGCVFSPYNESCK